jgi:hypothetical protein
VTRSIRLGLAGTDLSAVADLLDEMNPEACDVFWRNVPYRSTLYHTLVSGKNVYSFFPEVTPVFEKPPTVVRRMATAPGTIFSPYPRGMLIKYGPDSEDRSFAPIAQVRADDLPALAEMGKRTWDSVWRTKQPLTLEVTHVGSPAPDAPGFAALLVAPGTCADAAIAELVADINAEIERIWLRVPDEVQTLHSGKHSAGTGLGSYGQYFSALFFAEKETSRISNIAGSGAIDNLLRLCHESDIDLETLKTTTKIFCAAQVEFLAICGQRTIAGFFQRAVALFDRISTKAEYSRLFATYALYGTRYNAWQLWLFPWSVGQGHAYDTERTR